MNNFGLKIVPHQFAREVRDEWIITRWPSRKKRRGWQVVKHHIDLPGAYQIGNTIYAHPDIIEKLKAFAK